MLRWSVLVLLLANLAFWAWSEGWFVAPLGMGPAVQREPARLTQQIQPDSIRVLSPEAVKAALAGAASAPTPGAALKCLEAGPFAPAALESAEQVLASAAPGSGWIRASREIGAQYAVYIGPLAGREALQKKTAELRALKVAFEEVRPPGEPDGGLALGRYDTRAEATSALETLARRGVRTARVVVMREASTEWRLRVDNAGAALAEQLRALALPGALTFTPCAAG
jgi:hypothetical protein